MAKLQMVEDGHLGGYIQGGDPGTWCPHLWAWAVQRFQIRSVLDVGCGEGHSTRFFHDLGCDVLGVDGCPQAIADSVVPGHVVQHDFCSGSFVPDRPFDLIWSCEFLEHVEERFVPNILGTFAHAAKMILVTHAFPGQDDGHHHVNCQSSAYWIQRFEAAGFHCDRKLTRQARTVTLNDYHSVNHFARSGLLLRRRPDVVEPVERDQLTAANPGLWSRLKTKTSAQIKAFAIHNSFRWSAPYLAHRRKRRAAKRARRLLT